ncbi:alpha-1,4-N-acetylglucosaminyltransferase-like [Amblyraja radiata]|uniref:alpha-1,4-N-acetylglucosaminyltransferase-like n=1 Tax=Amblyraja radiata TaxID=386614 RepID=UPI0014041891|nr:alpha-1,4-N-acetylglucosaminyltransferase-like [Amblyraja radiata]
MIPIHQIFSLVVIFGASVLLYVCWHLKTRQNVQKNMVRMSHVEDEAPMDDPRPLLNPGIMFVETTDKVELTPLVMCSVESTARQNPDKPIYFFMKGFSGNLSQYPEPKYRLIQLLSSMKNVVLLPLNATELFDDTSLKFWHRKVNPEKEKFWTHVFADGCRLALLWKYGGIYLDSDIISMRPMPFANFTCPQHLKTVSNGAIGFSHRHHPVLWNFMEDFVANYIGHIWGHQGPGLITRVLKRWCQTDNLAPFIGKECNGISIWITNRFYPITFPDWKKYYSSWKKKDIERTFSATYGAHVWNYMNRKNKKEIIAGSGSLIEHFFQLYCPTAYRDVIQLNHSSW